MYINDQLHYYCSFLLCRLLYDGKGPILSEEHDVDGTSYLVSLLLGFGIHTSDIYICQSVPKNVEANARFVVDTHKLRKSEDVKCDDCGSWINNGVRKLYLSVQHQNIPDLLDVIVITRGGKPKPKRRRTSSKDFADLTVVDRFTTSSQATTSSNTVATLTPSHQQQSTSSVSASLPSPAAQPYYIKVLNGHIKVWAGCRLGYANRNPPFDICIVHRETRPITHPVTKEKMNMVAVVRKSGLRIMDYGS